MTDTQKYALAALRQTIAVAGEPVRIGRRSFKGIVEDMTFDEIILSGGVGESGGFKAIIPVEDFSKKPVKLERVQAGDNTFQIMAVNLRNGIAYEITAGEPVAYER